MSHRPTRTAILTLQYFSTRLNREEAPPWEGHTNKRDVQAYLEANMENPPSGSTLTRIFQELEDLGYVERNTNYGLRHGRWYPTPKAQRLDPENIIQDSQIDLSQDLEELKEIAERTIDKAGLVGSHKAVWVQGLMDGITGLALLHPDLISKDSLEEMKEQLKVEPEDLQELEEIDQEDLDPEDIRNSPALSTYLSESPKGWECHFCSGYPTFYGLKNYLEHLEEAHDFIIDDIDVLRTFEV